MAEQEQQEFTASWEETPEAKAAIAKLHKTIYELELKAPDYGVGK